MVFMFNKCCYWLVVIVVGVWIIDVIVYDFINVVVGEIYKMEYFIWIEVGYIYFC